MFRLSLSNIAHAGNHVAASPPIAPLAPDQILFVLNNCPKPIREQLQKITLFQTGLEKGITSSASVDYCVDALLNVFGEKRVCPNGIIFNSIRNSFNKKNKNKYDEMQIKYPENPPEYNPTTPSPSPLPPSYGSFIAYENAFADTSIANADHNGAENMKQKIEALKNENEKLKNENEKLQADIAEKNTKISVLLNMKQSLTGS